MVGETVLRSRIPQYGLEVVSLNGSNNVWKLKKRRCRLLDVTHGSKDDETLQCCRSFLSARAVVSHSQLGREPS